MEQRNLLLAIVLSVGILIARAATGERPYGDLVGDLEAALRQIDRRPPGAEGGQARPPRVEEG